MYMSRLWSILPLCRLLPSRLVHNTVVFRARLETFSLKLRNDPNKLFRRLFPCRRSVEHKICRPTPQSRSKTELYCVRYDISKVHMVCNDNTFRQERVKLRKLKFLLHGFACQYWHVYVRFTWGSENFIKKFSGC